MLRDVFYFGEKPNVHPREKFAVDLTDARSQATTEHFWIINEFCDYRGFDWDFDFEFLPDEDVWAAYHINIWPSQHQKDSGTWLVNTDNESPVTIYRNDVDVVRRKNIKSDNWIELDLIDHTKFDFSWHPDPTDPPYIYKWGCKFFPSEIKHVLEYRVKGAVQVKYLQQTVELLPNDYWVEHYPVDKDYFDFTWRPDPLDPPFIYIWGNKYLDGKTTPTLEYHTPGATECKYLPQLVALLPQTTKFEHLEKSNGIDYSWIPDPTAPPYIYVWGNQWNKPEDKISIQYVVEGATEYKYMEQRATRSPCMDNWFVPIDVDTTGFDFSWEPSPADPAYIYEFGTQHQKTGGPQYIVEGATEKKYIEFQKVKALPNKDKWVIPNNIDVTNFDFSWHPDSTDPGYIYQFGTQWALSGGPKFIVDGAKEIKYMDNMTAIALPNKDNWEVPAFIDSENFDYSWHPYAEDEPYIYQFGTQHQKTGGPCYLTPGVHKNSQVKYIDTRILKSTRLPSKKNFAILNNYKIKEFDYSWHPDTTEEPFIYVFGCKLYPPEVMPVIEYVVPGAKQIKYITDVIAVLDQDKTNWEIPNNIDTSEFDFSWKPNPKDPPYIYEFGTQHQKTGGPKYIVQGATETKYVSTQQVKFLPNKASFKISTDCVLDLSDFDFSWHPDSSDPPYIYAWGNQWNKAEDKAVLTYTVSGAAEFKYMKDVVKSLPNRKNWVIPDDVDVSDFDFSWEPNPHDDPFVYQFGTQHQKTGGPRYVLPGLDDSPIKYIDVSKAKKISNRNNFVILNGYKIKDFDWSWHPDETDESYIYVFGNNQYPAEIMPTIEYAVPGAKQIKYINSVTATLDDDRTNWVIPESIDVSEFDFSWKPNPKEPPYIYQFGTQWQKTGGPKYIVPGATDVKYIDSHKAKALPNKKNWVLPDKIQIDEFDYSWHPDATEQPYTYQFGTQWQLTGGPRYVSPNSIGVKYIDPSELHAKAAINMSVWEIPESIDRNSFDFSWHPHPDDPDYMYQFGTQHQKTGGPKYIPNVADSEMLPTKYVDTRILKAIRLPTRKNWEVPEGISTIKFDFSWHPDDTDPKYIIQFGTMMNDTDGPKYIPPNDIGTVVYKLRVEVKDDSPEFIEVPRYYITTTLDDLVKKYPTETFWALRDNIDYAKFDFSWRPQIVDIAWESNYVHVFGSSDSEITQTYFVNAVSYLKGNRGFKFVETKTLDSATLASLFKKPSMFFVDRGNIEAQSRYEQLKNRFPDLQKTRYLNTWVDTISRCINRSSTELCWIINSELDYSSFNFEYYPNPWQIKMVHVFGTQWSHWGTTFMVNRETFANDTKYIKVIEHLSNLNFVKDQDKRAKATNCLYDVFVIDHGNKEVFKTFRTIQSRVGDKSVTNIEYTFSYLNTFKNILALLPEKKEHYIWICSSVCDYSKFDFTYICDPFAREQLHVFPSDKQKFGDTFLVNVNKLRELIESMSVLEDYDKVNFNQHQRLPRYQAPEIVTDDDTHTSSLDIRFDYPYVVLTTEDNRDIEKVDVEPMNLWSPENKNIIITSTGGTRIMVPKEIKDVVKREFYDYPYIVKSSRLAKSKPLDIVFLSNGEKCADENYEHLLKVTNGLNNRIVRVDGVKGRVNAYHAAANASETPWMFTVFAKLKVSNKFDWNWQPDRLQVPKHYVFHAKNPVNGLVYGHQAMIAYNKKMTLNNAGRGLDFTQDDLHEVLNINSGVANFNVDEWTTWRTAFRECIKLCTYGDDISNERLKVWTTVANGEFAQYCLDGANDAVNYFDEVAGDYDQLKLSYDWVWLKEKFLKRYKL